jgi:sugar phosphate isomerase/epimerase
MGMTTIAVTVSDELRTRLESAADAAGLPLDTWLREALAHVVTGPPIPSDTADTIERDEDPERLRRRLAEAGLLMVFEGPPPERPSAARLAEARAAAGRGRPLSDYVSEGRG